MKKILKINKKRDWAWIFLSLGVLFLTAGTILQDKELTETTERLVQVEKINKDLIQSNANLFSKVEELTKENGILKTDIEKRNTEITTLKKKINAQSVSRGSGRAYTITAYDLSYGSCEKYPSDPAFGVTASGISLRDKFWSSGARYVAADGQYSFGTKLQLTFKDSAHQKYNGVYTVVDRGGAIKGSRLDLFMGDYRDNRNKITYGFGRTQATVSVVK